MEFCGGSLYMKGYPADVSQASTAKPLKGKDSEEELQKWMEHLDGDDYPLVQFRLLYRSESK